MQTENTTDCRACRHSMQAHSGELMCRHYGYVIHQTDIKCLKFVREPGTDIEETPLPWCGGRGD